MRHMEIIEKPLGNVVFSVCTTGASMLSPFCAALLGLGLGGSSNMQTCWKVDWETDKRSLDIAQSMVFMMIFPQIFLLSACGCASQPEGATRALLRKCAFPNLVARGALW